VHVSNHELGALGFWAAYEGSYDSTVTCMSMPWDFILSDSLATSNMFLDKLAYTNLFDRLGDRLQLSDSEGCILDPFHVLQYEWTPT
jgi:hypothetical protein